jgi:DHA1 family bicyclomycin/chloramphenicol resistance-like MFS transporter
MSQSAPSPVTPAVNPALLVAVLAALAALGPLSMHIFLPALPVIALEFAVSAGTAQLVLSVALFAIALSTLIYGPLSDRFGRRPVMIAGLVIFLAGSAVAASAPTIPVLIGGRVLQAVGAAAGMTVGRAVIRDLYDRETAARLMAYTVTALVVAPTVAPLIGGLLNDFAGWRAIFVFSAGLGVLVLLVAMPKVPETIGERLTGIGLRGMVGGFGSLLRVPQFRAYAGLISFGMGMFMAFIGAAPYVTIGVLGRPPTEFGLFFMLVSAGFMLGTLTTARVTKRVGLDRMLVIGSALGVGFGLVLVGMVAAGIWTTWAFFLPGAGMAFANGLVMPNAQSAAISVNPRLAGSASGLTGFLQMTTGALFAQAAGSLQNGTPWPMAGLMLGAAACAFLSITLVPLIRRRR